MNILRDFDQVSLWVYWWEIKLILHCYCRLSVQNYWLPNACKPTGARNRCIVGTREVQLNRSRRRRRVVTVRPARDAQPANTATVRVTHLGGWACMRARRLFIHRSLGIRLRRSPRTRHVVRHADAAFANGAAADPHFTLAVDLIDWKIKGPYTWKRSNNI